ncbi:hypothetical protein DXG03_006717 [Asterophora parasitica]|uniref:Inhibitor I9 domain-containing protein n=1 Tax=Asterophora parasitica TaxID=117018 RepID=A0A9P7G942_9AGAR|nr:hypothetical protein DXG03_006717 [Asterophora parasitica]
MSTQKYIVVFKEHVTKEQVNKYAEDVNQNGGEVTNRWDTVLNGFAAVIPDAHFQKLQSLTDDVIDYIGALTNQSRHDSVSNGIATLPEPDGIVTTQ